MGHHQLTVIQKWSVSVLVVTLGTPPALAVFLQRWSGTQPVGCYTEVVVVIQRWSAYTVEPVYSGHP